MAAIARDAEAGIQHVHLSYAPSDPRVTASHARVLDKMVRIFAAEEHDCEDCNQLPHVRLFLHPALGLSSSVLVCRTALGWLHLKFLADNMPSVLLACECTACGRDFTSRTIFRGVVSKALLCGPCFGAAWSDGRVKRDSTESQMVAQNVFNKFDLPDLTDMPAASRLLEYQRRVSMAADQWKQYLISQRRRAGSVRNDTVSLNSSIDGLSDGRVAVRSSIYGLASDDDGTRDGDNTSAPAPSVGYGEIAVPSSKAAEGLEAADGDAEDADTEDGYAEDEEVGDAEDGDTGYAAGGDADDRDAMTICVT